MTRTLALLAASVALAGCMSSSDGTEAASTGTPGARVQLASADGAARGSAIVSSDGAGLMVKVTASGLPAGTHGIHIHTTGRCDGPKFESAGGHWNPTTRQHGRDNPQGAHHGDLPNITIAADGTGSLSFDVPDATLAGLLDADGAALLIHAQADDYRTDPSGNSGDRIACGVVTRN